MGGEKWEQTETEKGGGKRKVGTETEKKSGWEKRTGGANCYHERA